jgi:hypothetical protein
MYDGVRTHGFLHRLRMEDVFWHRLRVQLKMAKFLVSAMPAPVDQNQADLITKTWRELIDSMFPKDKAAEKEREDYLKGLLVREGGKSYEIKPIDD